VIVVHHAAETSELDGHQGIIASEGDEEALSY
jgi:hypothetical protein